MRRKRTEIVRVMAAPQGELYGLAEVARLAGLHPDIARSYLLLGLIEPIREEPEPLFSEEALYRLGRVLRLRRDLGVNLASAGIILDLLDRIEALEREMDRLHGRP